MLGFLHYTDKTWKPILQIKLVVHQQLNMLNFARHEKDFLARLDLSYEQNIQRNYESLL